MKKLLFCLSVLTTFLPAVLTAQADFTGVPDSGCDSLTVNFSYTGVTVPSSIVWDFGNGDTSQRINPLPVFYDSPGTYTVRIRVNNNLEAVKSNYIKIRPVPAASFVYSDTLEPGSFNYVFRAVRQPVDTALYNYRWKFENDTAIYNKRSMAYQFPAEGIYHVKLIIRDDFGCRDSVDRRISVSENLRIPNVFTPNNDNINDLFIIPVNGVILYNLRIYSRYGALIFNTESFYPVWDGYNSAGVKMNPGIYYYTLTSVEPDNGFSQTGFVYLLSESTP